VLQLVPATVSNYLNSLKTKIKEALLVSAFFMAAKYCIMSNTELRFFTGYSLVDITATGVIRVSNPESIERDQQRNWETVLQCMG
jgi:hypothetical protein